MKRSTFALALCVAAAVTLASATAAELTTQKNTQRGVTVTVTPQSLAGETKTWDFKIVLETHGQDLSDDLASSALLLDDSGGRQAPLAWEGAGPATGTGGRHDEGGTTHGKKKVAAKKTPSKSGDAPGARYVLLHAPQFCAAPPGEAEAARALSNRDHGPIRCRRSDLQ